jgi:MoxR-like ATPase
VAGATGMMTDQDGVDGRRETTERRASAFASHFESILTNVARVIKGKEEAIRMALVCLFAEGHLLIEDVPGTGKTTLAKALAHSIDGTWQRIQFTPDLLPTDVTGVQIYNRQSHQFEFHPGGVFANIVVADEINRASPKTQSALLEVMEERQVTVDSTPYLVPRPFIVVATQNPVELEGTYDLPEAQIDRFMMKISIGYPSLADEVAVVANDAGGTRAEDLPAVVSSAEVRRMIAVTDRVYLAHSLQEYLVTVCARTRELPQVRLGASPRGSVALARASRSLAAANGRPFVIADDVKLLAPLVLAHRMILNPEAELNGESGLRLLLGILEDVPVPQERIEI